MRQVVEYSVLWVQPLAPVAESMNAMFLDSPTWTTGAITYKAQVQSDSDWMGINRTYTDADSSTAARMISTITAWEILA